MPLAQVPEAAGQPVWLVIVLAVLTLAGGVAVAWLSRPRKDQGGGGTVGTPDATVSALQGAMDHLARVADREAAESDEARRETQRLRRELELTMSELERARADLESCQEHAARLSQQVWGRQGDE